MKKLNKPYTDKDWLYQKYVVEKLSMTKMGVLCDCRSGVINQWLNKYGIPTRNRSEAWKIRIDNDEVVSLKERVVRSKRMMGNKYAYRGGRRPKYTNVKQMELNRWRAMRKYDHTCQSCGREANICHHIDFSTDNHELDNLLPMCYSCHFKLHYKAYKQSKLREEQATVSC